MNLAKKIILLSYISVASASAAIITPALPTIANNFHLSNGRLEWIVTLFLLGYMVGQLIYGPIANRFGRLTALRSGFIVNLIGILICIMSIYSHHYLLLLLGRLITALGAAAGLCCTFTLINELLEEEQAKQALSYAVLSFALGIGLAIFIGGFLTQYFNWTVIFYILLLHGLIMLFSTCLFQETLAHPKPIHFYSIMQSYLNAFSNQRLVLFSLFLGFVSVFSYCYSAAAPMIASSYLGLRPAQYGSWNSLTMIGMFLGSLSAAQLLKRLSMSRVLWLSVIFIAIGLISFTLQLNLDNKNSLWFFSTATYLYFFSSWLFPCASFFASKAITDRANASGRMSFINMGSATLSVAIMGYLPFNKFTSLIIIVCVFLLICCLFYLFNKEE